MYGDCISSMCNTEKKTERKKIVFKRGASAGVPRPRLLLVNLA